MDEPPAAPSARTSGPPGDPRFAEVGDVRAVQLRFPSGRLAQVPSGYSSSTKRIEVQRSGAAATLDPATGYMGDQPMVKRGKDATGMRSPFGSQVRFDRELDHLSRAVMDGTEGLTPGEMGLRDRRLIEAACRSAAAAGQWIELDPDGSARA